MKETRVHYLMYEDWFNFLKNDVRLNNRQAVRILEKLHKTLDERKAYKYARISESSKRQLESLIHDKT